MEPAMPLVSIIMSVYNSEQWLQKTIDSVIAQTYTNWEFIIVEDGSTDNGKKILEAYQSDGRFKLIYREQNVGYVKNLNHAITFCKGAYIARMDADDICLPERFEKQVAFLGANPTISMVGGFINFIDENDQPKGVWKADRKYATPAAIQKRLPFENCIAHPSIMIRAELLQKFRYNELQTNSEDWDLWLQLSAAGHLIGKVQEPILLYRQHNKSVTAKSLKESAFRKNKNTYYQYFKVVQQEKKWNRYNCIIWFAAFINRVKLQLSAIKRFFYH